MQKAIFRGLVAVVLALVTAWIGASGAAAQAGPCFKNIGGHLVYTCPVPKPPVLIPHPYTISVAAGPHSGMNSFGADNIYITAIKGGQKISGSGMVIDGCTITSTGSSLAPDDSPWVGACVVNADSRIPCDQTGDLNVTFVSASGLNPQGAALSNTAKLARNCVAWNTPPCPNCRRKR